ncbi:MAG: MBL fold metallo-hydrolase [Halodesulfurarchaeum sp.]
MVTELTADVWWLDLTGVNAYLVGGEEVTLVDGGMPWHAGSVREGLSEVGYDVADVDRVLLTHYDLDHVGGLGRLEDLDAPVYVGRNDADFVAGRRRPPLTNRKSAFQWITGRFARPPPGPVRAVSDGEEIGQFTAVHTPGHTEGHMAFVSEQSDVAFVGDLLRNEGNKLQQTPWFFTRDPGEIPDSVDTLTEVMPPVEVIAFGHGDPILENGYRILQEYREPDTH